MDLSELEKTESFIEPIEKRITDHLQKTWLRFKSTTYLVMIVAGFGIAVSLTIAVGAFYPMIDDLKWYFLGLAIYSVLGFAGMYLLEFYEHVSINETLLTLASALAGGLFFVYVIEPRLDMDLGYAILTSFFSGWALGWSILGIPMYRHKKWLETQGIREASVGEVQQRRYDVAVASGLAVPMAIIMVFLSDAIMLFIVSAIFVEGLVSGDLLLLFVGLVFASPSLISILLTVFALKKARIKFYMLAATISGFSFAAPLSIVAELLLWRAHSLGGWRW